ncbi:MAG: DUF3857 domain-containing protein [Flavobacterium sp.]|nr:MAG: DUF3857 domain-containing protein [Flavobacterium sp.]
MMKKILPALLLFISAVVSAQDKDEVVKMFWGSNDAEAKATEVPDKWKDESAVILYEYNYYYYPSFYPKQGYRKRIKLQDAASVKEYSEFSFKELSRRRGNTEKSTLGIKIIKPGGKEIIVDVDELARQVDDDRKLAVGGLEIGDIIDYFYYLTVTDVSSIADKQESTLNDVYPTMNLRVELQLDKKLFLNLNTYNGAPGFVDLPPGRKGDRRLELRASDIPKVGSQRWIYPMLALPCYKWQMSAQPFGKPDKSIADGKVKTKITKEDMMFSYGERYRPFGDMQHIERFIKNKTFANDADKVRQVYYFTRHFYYTQYVEAWVINDAKIFSPFELYKNPIFLNGETEFINHFMAFLKDNKIDYDIVLATARFNGPLTDLLLDSNIDVMLRVNTAPEPVYLRYFSPFTGADQIDANLENTDAYVLNVLKRKKITDVEQVHLPSSTFDDNQTKVVSTITLDAGMSGLKVSRESSYTGHFKEDEQSNHLYFFDYVNEDYQRYETEPLLDKVRNNKKQAQYKKEYAALIAKVKDKQKENFIKSVSEEYDVKIDKYDFSIKNTGRFGSREPLVYNESFELANSFVKKAGENYVIEIGKMLTGQIEIGKNEKDRKSDVYMPFPRTLENEIVFEIPSGYSVSGIDKLNKTVTNATGGFTSIASLSGNKLTIKTRKFYKNYFEPNANWSKMIDFLDAAYQFTQEKVLLKKA